MNETTTLANTPVSPLQTVMNDNGDQLDKLSSLVMSLGSKLAPICANSPEGNVEKVAEQGRPFAGSSDIVAQAERQGDTIRRLQSAIVLLTNNLEV